MQIGLYKYDEKLRTCWFYRTYNRYLFSSLTLFGTILPCCLIIFFYLKIFIHITQAKQRAQTHKLIQKNQIDFKFSMGLFLSILLYICTIVPYSIVAMIDYKDTLPAAYHLYGLVLMRINSCLNPLLYGLTNTLFKKGFKNIYFLLFDRKQYSFSIEVKERKILNERLLLQELNLNKLTFLKREEENSDINNDLNILDT